MVTASTRMKDLAHTMEALVNINCQTISEAIALHYIRFKRIMAWKERDGPLSCGMYER